MENKIEQIGNLYYLYRFGFYSGLCESIVRGLGRNRSASDNSAVTKGEKTSGGQL